jgi:hypothetical protein
MSAGETGEWLFSYGTLRQPEVQIENFGRLLQGFPDTLAGYSLSVVDIIDQKVIGVSGASRHPIIRFTGNSSDEVAGMVFQVTSGELTKADAYEVSDYRRIAVQLRSGRTAFAYAAFES